MENNKSECVPKCLYKHITKEERLFRRKIFLASRDIDIEILKSPRPKRYNIEKAPHTTLLVHKAEEEEQIHDKRQKKGKHHEASIHLSDYEYEQLYIMLNHFVSEETEEEEEEEEEQHTRRIRENKAIFEKSLMLYEVFMYTINCMINFHASEEDDSLQFCYIHACDERDVSLNYIKLLAYTETCVNYAGFSECAIFRIIKLCPSCYDVYTAKQALQPNYTTLITINQRAYKLFSLLTTQ